VTATERYRYQVLTLLVNPGLVRAPGAIIPTVWRTSADWASTKSPTANAAAGHKLRPGVRIRSKPK
jgi:hypothetical protein